MFYIFTKNYKELYHKAIQEFKIKQYSINDSTLFFIGKAVYCERHGKYEIIKKLCNLNLKNAWDIFVDITTPEFEKTFGSFTNKNFYNEKIPDLNIQPYASFKETFGKEIVGIFDMRDEYSTGL